MELIVKRWGNSLALRIPSTLAEAAHISEESVLSANVRNGRLVLEKKTAFSLDGLVDELKAGAKLEPLVDWGAPVGTEFGAETND
ncbi:AbrB/MazE/SpoVT family DNA-binding domain-containing protein [Ralstonia pseudosolanacearum]